MQEKKGFKNVENLKLSGMMRYNILLWADIWKQLELKQPVVYKLYRKSATLTNQLC